MCVLYISLGSCFGICSTETAKIENIENIPNFEGNTPQNITTRHIVIYCDKTHHHEAREERV